MVVWRKGSGADLVHGLCGMWCVVQDGAAKDPFLMPLARFMAIGTASKMRRNAQNGVMNLLAHEWSVSFWLGKSLGVVLRVFMKVLNTCEIKEDERYKNFLSAVKKR